MSKFARLTRLSKKFIKADVVIKASARKYRKQAGLVKRVTKLSAVGLAAGGVGGHMVAQAGLQDPARKKGMKWGAITGASIAAAPSVGRIVFRRIRGRIIPILKKF